MKNNIIEKYLKSKFKEVEIIDVSEIFDGVSFVFSKRQRQHEIEYMVHNAYFSEDESSCVFEFGHYISSFSEAARIYLSKFSRQQVVVPLSEEDLSDLQSGEHFEWDLKDQFGIPVDVVVKAEEDEDYE